MNVIWAIILFVLSAIAYLGQAIAAFWPNTAAKLGLTEAETDVDPTFYADVRGEAFWDTATLWTLPAAALLLLFNHPAWVYLGLIGGGMYLYFAGRGIIVRRQMQRRAIPIGKPAALKTAYLFLGLWGLAAIITIIIALAELSLN